MTVTWIPVVMLTAADVAAQQSVCRISALPPIVAAAAAVISNYAIGRRVLVGFLIIIIKNILSPVLVDDQRWRRRGEIGRTRAHARRRPKSPNDRTVVLTFSPRLIVHRLPWFGPYRTLVECYVQLRVERHSTVINKVVAKCTNTDK